MLKKYLKWPSCMVAAGSSIISIKNTFYQAIIDKTVVYHQYNDIYSIRIKRKICRINFTISYRQRWARYL